jgi:hypothetical protein
VGGLNNNGEHADIFAEGLMGGLLQVPLPIPEILSSINRTKFDSSQFKL